MEGRAQTHQHQPLAGSDDEQLQLQEMYEDSDETTLATLAARSEGGLSVSNC